MSNKIFGTDIVDQSASVEVKKLQTDLQSLLNTFIQTSGAVDLMRKALSNVTDYNNASDAIGKNTKALDEMQRVKNQIIALQRQIAVTNSDEYKSLVALREERNKNNRELREKAKATLYASEAYKKLEAEYSKAAREAKNLGAELGTNSKQFVDAAQKANLLNNKLKAIDAGMGVHTRNVGNYISATHSLSQVLRELPAFTYSAQTGVLALSNNLPILADQFKAVKLETGSTGEALKVFGASLFSFGNIFTIAIGLVTVFWDKIVGIAKSTKDAANSMNAFNESIKASAGEITILHNLYAAATDVTMSMEKRMQAVDELQRMYPAYFANLKDEEILIGNAARAYDELVNSLMNAAIFKAFEKNMEPQFALLAQQLERLNTLVKEKDSFFGLTSDQANRTKDLSKRQENYNKAIEEQKAIIDATKKSIREQYDAAKDYFTLLKKEGKAAQSATTTTPVRSGTSNGSSIVSEAFDFSQQFQNLNSIDKEINAMNERTTQASIKRVQDSLDAKEKRNREATQMELDLIKEWEQGWNEFYDNLDRKEREKIDKQIKYATELKELSDSVTYGLSAIYDIQHAKELSQIDEKSKANQSYYDEEEKRIKTQFTNKAEQERELAKLEAQRAAQEKAIERERIRANRRRAQQQKALDIANIITTTSLAVMGALSRVKTDGPTAYIQAAGIGITGAAQLAKAIAAPLPEYKDGTGPDGHKGGLAIVGDGGVPEYIQEPGKKGYWSKPFAEIVDLPAKTIVTPPEKLLQNIMDNAMTNLGRKNIPVNALNYQEQLIAEFEAMTAELKATKEILKRQKLESNYHIDFNHELWVKNNIR